MAAPIVHFDYEFSPYGQKTKLLLAAAGIDFTRCDVPPVLPRPQLEGLQITYRRIPVLAVGKDIYFDTHLIQETIINELSKGSITTSKSDLAFKEWGDNTFAEALGLVSPEVFTEDFKKDRETVNFNMVKRPDFATIRPSAVASFRQRLRQVEDVFLAEPGPFIDGDQISVADVHVGWIVRWALYQLDAQKEPALAREHFPKTYRFIDSLPTFSPTTLSPGDAHKTIRGAQYTAKGPPSVQKDDPHSIAAGTVVHIEAFDTVPGAHPQAGKLVATDDHEVVVEVDQGLHLHFPRIGYIVKAQ